MTHPTLSRALDELLRAPDIGALGAAFGHWAAIFAQATPDVYQKLVAARDERDRELKEGAGA